jgi:hypothetical protein
VVKEKRLPQDWINPYYKPYHPLISHIKQQKVNPKDPQPVSAEHSRLDPAQNQLEPR